MPYKKTTWTLKDEMDYLNNLGKMSHRRSNSRRELLKSYVKLAATREAPWAQEAVAYAKQLLLKEFGEQL